MRRRSRLSVSLLTPALVVAGLAVRSATGPATDSPAVRLAAAASAEPVDDTVPTTLPPPFGGYESLCPGLDLDPELIPPQFLTEVEPLPDPGPIEVCPLLRHTAERHPDSPSGNR